MAFCPKCSGVMEGTAILCPHCGYDFPMEPESRRGIAYSPRANIALIVGIVAAGLGCAGSTIAAIVALVNEQLLTAFFIAPLAFFQQLALLVLFVRVQRI